MAFLSLKKFVPAHCKVVCGIDEVGRGPWAGPLVACALVLKKNIAIKGLKDSKQLMPERREEIFKILQRSAHYGLGIVEVEEIDAFGLIKATNLAFIRALENLPTRPDFLLVDGRDKLNLPHPFITIIKGDEKLKPIACASIIAKVTRDRMMLDLHKKYPQYAFDEHKGYGTRKHQHALRNHGICPLHRKSFKPVQAIISPAIQPEPATLFDAPG